MSTETEKLAARIEGLLGPDRDVDALIAPLQGLRIVDEGHPLGRCCYDQNGVLVVLPSYTRSLDAAMTLVPEGWLVDLEIRPNRTAQVTLGHLGDDKFYDEPEHFSDASTAALAVCAASLRARARPTTTGEAGL